jgi:integrase
MTRNGTDRFVTLNIAAVAVLRRLQERHRELGLGLMFHSKREGLIKNPRKWFATALEQAKIKGGTWHTLRHTSTSRLVMAGVDLKTVQEPMGHKTIAMTARDAHVFPDTQVAGAGDPGASRIGFGTKWLFLATNTKKVTRNGKLNSIQLIESK